MSTTARRRRHPGRDQVTLPGPSITHTVRASADQVIHIRQNSDPTCPWRGRSGLAVAQASGGLAATLVRALTAEGEVPVTRIIPQPQGDSQTTADSIRHAITTGLRLALPETVAGGGGAGRSSAPLTDWKPYRLGPEYMAAGVELHALALQETAGVCGLPAPMVPGSAAAGPAHREAFRQFRGADGATAWPDSRGGGLAGARTSGAGSRITSSPVPMSRRGPGRSNRWSRTTSITNGRLRLSGGDDARTELVD